MKSATTTGYNAILRSNAFFSLLFVFVHPSIEIRIQFDNDEPKLQRKTFVVIVNNFRKD